VSAAPHTGVRWSTKQGGTLVTEETHVCSPAEVLELVGEGERRHACCRCCLECCCLRCLSQASASSARRFAAASFAAEPGCSSRDKVATTRSDAHGSVQ
jgi:hypothetical protein